MAYTVKEIYFTLQGEGALTGRPAIFLRFAGCNLWTGLEKDRATAVCSFCDTDFVGTDGPGGGKFSTASELVDAVSNEWPDKDRDALRYVVCTGGEPLLQLDNSLVEELHARSFEVAVETNGTIKPPPGIDWLCVSPKAGADLVVVEGDELKLVYPQEGVHPEQYEQLAFRRFSLQPMDGPRVVEFTRRAMEYCMTHPRWHLSLQVHKLLGLP